jgi:glycosyltransferase involved in cell wall biosynthesis
MPNLPIVSVLMTAFNREQYIAEAIESVLKSSFNNFELIVVDDCSSDNTLEISKSYEKKDSRVNVYQNEKNLGDYPNRNKAASYAKGKYIKYLDSDDLMYPHCLEVMVNCMEQFPEAVYGLCAVYDAKGPYPSLLNPRDAYIEHFYGFGHFNRAPGSAIILKKAFEKVGGFSGKRMIGDLELWFILSRNYPLVKMPLGLVWSRLHDAQELRSKYADNYAVLTKKVIEESLDQPDCPISQNEIKDIKKTLKRRKRKHQIIKLLKL